MGESVIPLADLRVAASPMVVPADRVAPAGRLVDRLGRELHDLRISVTDRCNFRCGYCMPREVFDSKFRFLPHDSLLSFEEIARVARLFVAHGVRKIRLTGGEPLLRKQLPELVEQLAALRTVDGAKPELTLTTNGTLLPRFARPLRDAGLDRVTVSLDAIDDATFRKMNDAGHGVAEVLRGIDSALAAGFGRVKINMVVQRGTNDGEIVPLARHVRDAWGQAATLRFIEYMDVGSSNGWRLDEVLPSEQVLARLDAAFGIEPLGRSTPDETAERWRWRDGRGEIGIISSVTRAFCRDCSRARLSTEGKLFLCLFASRGHDLRALLRGGADDAQIAGAIGLVWNRRDDRYSELRAQATADGAAREGERRVEMHYIGG